MLNFSKKMTLNSDVFVLFVNEKGNFIDRSKNLKEAISLKIKSYIKQKQKKKNIDEVFSLDIDEKTKCFLVKVSNKNNNCHYEELGARTFSLLKSFKIINKLDFFYLIDFNKCLFVIDDKVPKKFLKKINFLLKKKSIEKINIKKSAR